MTHGTLGWVLVVVFLLFLAVLLTACATPLEQVVLLPGDDASQLTVRTPQATATLQTPYETAAAEHSGQIRPGTTTPEIVHARYGAVLQTLPAAGQVWTLRFDTGAIDLTPESQAEVPALLQAIAGRAVEVEITGFTDQTGDDAANDTLALARAEAVRELLVAQGMQATFVRVVGRGSRQPIVNRPGEAEAANRRVEVVVR